MPERTTILRPSENIVRGNIVDQDVSEILTSCEGGYDDLVSCVHGSALFSEELEEFILIVIIS